MHLPSKAAGSRKKKRPPPREQLLERIEYAESGYVKDSGDGGEYRYSAPFPQSDILFEQREDSLNRYLEEVLGMDHDRYIFCQLAREFPLWDTPLGKKS